MFLSKYQKEFKSSEGKKLLKNKCSIEWFSKKKNNIKNWLLPAKEWQKRKTFSSKKKTVSPCLVFIYKEISSWKVNQFDLLYYFIFFRQIHIFQRSIKLMNFFFSFPSIFILNWILWYISKYLEKQFSTIKIVYSL